MAGCTKGTALLHTIKARHAGAFLRGLSWSVLRNASVGVVQSERSYHNQTDTFHLSLFSPHCCKRHVLFRRQPASMLLSQPKVSQWRFWRTFYSHNTKHSPGEPELDVSEIPSEQLKNNSVPASAMPSEQESSSSVMLKDKNHSLSLSNSHTSETLVLTDADNQKSVMPAYNYESTDTLISEAESEDVKNFEDLPAPKSIAPSYNLAVYFKQSEVLQKLVGLGADLSAVEKIPEAADYLVQSSWDKDIQPKLLFLKDMGVQDGDLGKVLTKNPLILKEDMEEMKVRIDYFRSKKFNTENIGRIVTSAPVTLLMPPTMVDKKLGYLQKTFSLSGDEVRAVAVRLPKIIPWRLQKLKDIRFYMKEMLGFSEQELKAMLLAYPKVYLSDKHQLGKRFDFLYNVMGLSHKDLVQWPAVLRTRLHLIQQRHRFLVSVDRAQYDPTKENYVSLKALVSGQDRDFCFHVAKASTTQFNNFLKAV